MCTCVCRIICVYSSTWNDQLRGATMTQYSGTAGPPPPPPPHTVTPPAGLTTIAAGENNN